MRRWSWLLLASTLLASWASPALAQDPQQQAMGRALFDEAVALMKENRFSEACPKLAESLALDPAGGTAVDLAFCYEHDGKVASALDAYRAAVRIDERDGRDDRKQAANERIAELEKRVGHVRLVADADAWKNESWQVMLDARALGPDALDAPLPIDGGRHVVTVTAAGKRAYVRQIEIFDGATTDVTIAKLDDVGAPVTPGPTPRVALPPTFVLKDDVPRRNWGIGLGAGGIGALGVGIVSGIVAANLHSKSDRLCPATGCTGDGVSAENQANGAAWVSDVAFVAGVALVGVGTYLFLSARHAKRVPAANDSALGRVVFDLR